MLFGEFTYYYAGQVDTYGAVQHTSGITLPRNALVEEFDVLVTAARATAVRANVVAQVRAGPSSDTAIGDNGLSVVVDFGTPRTVNAVSVPSPYKVATVKIWNGAQFVAAGTLPRYGRRSYRNAGQPDVDASACGAAGRAADRASADRGGQLDQ